MESRKVKQVLSRGTGTGGSGEDIRKGAGGSIWWK
jgi:hypothetical protein